MKVKTTITVVITGILLTLGIASAQDNEGREPLGPPRIWSMAWSPDGAKIAVGEGPDVCGPIHTIRILDAETLEEVDRFEEHRCIINTVAFSPDSTRLASSDNEGNSLVWDVVTGEIVTTAEGGGPERGGVTWSPDGTKIADSTGSVVSIWDAATGQILTLIDSLSFVTILDWSPDSRKMAIGNTSNEIQIWNLSTDQILSTFYVGPVFSVDWSLDGTKLLTIDLDGIVQVLDLATGDLLQIFNIGAVRSVRWTIDRTALASSSPENIVTIWDAVTGQQIDTFQYSIQLRQIAWSPDGTRLAIAQGDNSVVITEVSQSTEAARFIPSLS